ncbi:MAG: hypothetical protein JXX29_06895 [Deltaproteobacteria bacterium]|nr:hypothetical protein [Deltaproteobacteria bacterium]MBN2671380.1 hypothetical protein [Deltaproteobacteria bacterium]
MRIKYSPPYFLLLLPVLLSAIGTSSCSENRDPEAVLIRSYQADGGCTPGDRQFCSWMGVCNSDGTACICDNPAHWLSEEKCAIWHPFDPEAGLRCIPGDREPCVWHGSCNDSGDGCLCDNDWHGTTCEVHSSACPGWGPQPDGSFSTDVCQNHGECVDFGQCECDAGYNGDSCDEDSGWIAITDDGEIPNPDSGNGFEPEGGDRADVSVVKGESTITLVFSNDGLSLRETEVNGDAYVLATVAGIGNHGDVGSPALPFKGLFVELPFGVDPTLTVGAVTSVDIPIEYQIAPVQRVVEEDEPEPPFEKNEAVYSQNSFMPAELAEIQQLGVIRGRRVAYVGIHPVQYNPVANTVRAYSEIEITISYTLPSEPVLQAAAAQQSRLSSDAVNTLLSRIVVNYTEPTEADEPITGFDFHDALDSTTAIGPESLLLEDAPPNSVGADYLVIIDDTVYSTDCMDGGQNAVDNLLQWKEQKGYSTYVAKMSEIGATSAEVKEYIRNAYTFWQIPPAYVLIIGDGDTVPSNEIILSPTSSYFTDFPYSLTDGEDYWADIEMGRISVTAGSTECVNAINKMLLYDRNPDPGGQWYDNALLMAYFEDGDADCKANKWYADITGHVHTYFDNSGDMDVTAVMSANAACGNGNYGKLNATYPGSPAFPNFLRYNDADFIIGNQAGQQTAVANGFNTGVGLAVHRNHGTGTATDTYWSRPYFNNTDVNTRLTNAGMTPFVVSLDCSTGKFVGNHSIAESLTRLANGGGVGVIAPSRGSGSGPNDSLMQGLINNFWPAYDAAVGTAMSHDPSWRMGPALNYMKAYLELQYGTGGESESHSFMYHLFGDPEMEFRSTTPVAIDASTITTTYNDDGRLLVEGVPNGVLVGISQNDSNGHPVALGRAVAVDGTAEIVFAKPVLIGSSFVMTVTGHEYVPYTQILSPVTCRYYVTPTGDDTNDGRSWGNAFATIQKAIDAASTSVCSNVWVAAGTYTPGITSTDSFELKGAVTLFGGFNGTEWQLDQRNINTNETILSGDINGDDSALPSMAGRNENSYHVVRNLADAAAAIDGFVIESGNAQTEDHTYGGGIYMERDSQLSVVNCELRQNVAEASGSAIFAPWKIADESLFLAVINSSIHDNQGTALDMTHGQLQVTGCNFTNNMAVDGGALDLILTEAVISESVFESNEVSGFGGVAHVGWSDVKFFDSTFIDNSAGEEGGAIIMYFDRAPESKGSLISRCQFTNNTSGGEGGAVFITEKDDVTVLNSTFTENEATYGGGLSSVYATINVEGCLFAENTATVSGGGLEFRAGYDWMTVSNCTIVNNNADTSGGGIHHQYCEPTVSNCILWNNTTNSSQDGVQIRGDGVGCSEVAFTFNTIDGGCSSSAVGGCSSCEITADSGNSASDPLFANVAADDFRLQSTSPAIDSGNSELIESLITDLDGLSRVTDGDGDATAVVDRGAYEYQ